MRNYFILFVFGILYFSYPQNAKYLTESEMSTIAIENFKVNFAYDQITQMIKDNGKYDGYDTSAGTRFLKLLKIIKDTSRIIIKAQTEDNYWNDKFLIYKITKKYYQNWYTTAIGYDGLLYCLNGYRDKNFNNLLEQKIGSIDDEQKAIKVARFYLTYVEPETLAYRVIIDSININEYKHKYPEIHTINSRIWYKQMIIVAISTVEDEIGRVINHHFEFDKTKIKYETKLIKQDKEYRFD